ncbi:ribosome recycling factor [Candidatus Kaiserbacteria bacterium CG10_big_fil_rev_8_21_14_0_10_49_17]|uniref:Ribosome recycling factor n=1 Tax=Candidatus Kaiserbacteria bacterium CG10_big_fil_rev_8_21_14_0_10_49_17 TaxID=1974609 RepID=A0A2M6WE66_9BACT|nr:MAG: ribosome recycling factor [Candidatus Kaiserbacteria bacterium CG10_big_fil_rev_8_21_14_0_10_49_17]
MAYNFTALKEKVADAKVWLAKEFQGLRTGRATPAILDSIQVESYGSRVPINQVGSVSVEDARSLRISVWDPSHIKEIEKAITDANLGVSVSSDEKGVRVSFPELTADRRTQIVKIAKDKLEDARISIRTARDEVRQEILKQEKEGAIGEDDKFRALEEMQKIVDEGNKELEAMAERKEAEISN